MPLRRPWRRTKTLAWGITAAWRTYGDTTALAGGAEVGGAWKWRADGSEHVHRTFASTSSTRWNDRRLVHRRAAQSDQHNRHAGGDGGHAVHPAGWRLQRLGRRSARWGRVLSARAVELCMVLTEHACERSSRSETLDGLQAELSAQGVDAGRVRHDGHRVEGVIATVGAACGGARLSGTPVSSAPQSASGCMKSTTSARVGSRRTSATTSSAMPRRYARRSSSVTFGRSMGETPAPSSRAR